MNKQKYVVYAILTALCFSLYQPFSKIFLSDATDFMIVSFLYFGALIFSILSSVMTKKKIDFNFQKDDVVYLILITICNILAPMFLLFGLHNGNASNAALLSNFEVAVTTIIAVLFFKEKISRKQVIAISFIIIATLIVGFDLKSLTFDTNSLLFLCSTLCWAINNNCVAKISHKNTNLVIFYLGLSVGVSAFITALILNEPIPEFKTIIGILCVGVFSYGLCYYFYIKAQSGIGAALTSAYFGFAPFFATYLCVIILKEILEIKFIIGFIIMLISTIIIFIESIHESL